MRWILAFGVFLGGLTVSASAEKGNVVFLDPVDYVLVKKQWQSTVDQIKKWDPAATLSLPAPEDKGTYWIVVPSSAPYFWRVEFDVNGIVLKAQTHDERPGVLWTKSFKLSPDNQMYILQKNKEHLKALEKVLLNPTRLVIKKALVGSSVNLDYQDKGKWKSLGNSAGMDLFGGTPEALKTSQTLESPAVLQKQ